jgi:hypothetical protein
MAPEENQGSSTWRAAAPSIKRSIGESRGVVIVIGGRVSR